MLNLPQNTQLHKHIVSGSALICEYIGEKANGGYHQSWDWLMPVVEKIEQQFTVKIIRYADECSNICEIETTEYNPLQIAYCYGYDYDGKTKIQVVFDAVVEFIKWWNASLAGH